MKTEDPNRTIYNPSELDKTQLTDYRLIRVMDTAGRLYNEMQRAESRAQEIDKTYLNYLGADFQLAADDLATSIVADINNGDRQSWKQFTGCFGKLNDKQRNVFLPVIRKINEGASVSKGGTWAGIHPELEGLSVAGRGNDPVLDLADAALAGTTAYASAYHGRNPFANAGVALTAAFDTGVRIGNKINEVLGGTTWDDLASGKHLKN